MRKVMPTLVICMILAASPVLIPALAKKEDKGKSNVEHVWLYEKDPATWEIVKGGASGKLTYCLSGPTFDFVFNARKLDPNLGYTLIYYKDPWPGTGGVVIATGSTNDKGAIHLQGSVELNTDLPKSGDQNSGAKIWLVLSSDYSTDEPGEQGNMARWNPTEYLFENNLIEYDDTEVP